LIEPVTATLDRSVTARLMRQLKGKVAFWLYMKHVGRGAKRGNRGYQHAKQFVFDRKTKTGHIFVQR
jgi:hypothetical protein